MNVNYEKEYAVYGDINQGSSNEASLEAQEIENLIHESGKLQLNTYQAFVKNLMNPRSHLRSLLLIHMTGTGKTITALATATEYVKQYQANAENHAVSSVIVLGFTKDIFKKELLARSEFEFVNMDEAEELKRLETHMNDAQYIADEYHAKKKKYQKRLFKKDVKGIYQFYGYRQFTNRIINMEDVRTMIRKSNYTAQEKDGEISLIDIDTKLITKWIKSGDVRINTSFIQSLSNSLFICDEIHNLYKGSNLNTYGLAIECVFDYFFNTLAPNDAHYGSIRSLLLSATPLTSSALEIIPISILLTGEALKQSDIFKQSNGVEQITTSGMSKVRQLLSGRVSYIMDDNPKEYPTSSFYGETIKGIEYIKFVRSTPTGHQLKFFQNVDKLASSHEHSEDKGNNMVKDIVMPSTKSSPYGVIFSKNVADLAELPKDTAVYKQQNGTYTSNIFELSKLKQYSCKYAELVKLCLEKKDKQHGKIFIYHPFIQGSGTDLIISILQSNGFVLNGDLPRADSICMECKYSYGVHKNVKDHEFLPVQFTYITGVLTKPVVSARLSSFNNEQNVFGEKIKIIVGSRAMRESHTLKACRHVMIVHEPSSISEMIQIIGRAVRKNVHAMLPSDMRSVQISVLTTNVESIKQAASLPTFNEELAYQTKILQFKQINQIERIMYEVSIDYLINFRFKLRETPPLIGEPFPLNMTEYNQYAKKLTKDYTNIRNGVHPHSIATNRFNVFYFDGEVKLVIMLIKRILLSYQPLLQIAQLKELIRTPPFHVEYNTQLISNEAIIVGITKIVFTIDQLSVKGYHHKSSTIDYLYDQSPTIQDMSGREYKIVCYGDPLCDDSYIAKQSTASILEHNSHTIDLFKNAYQPDLTSSIDLQGLAANWASTITIDEIVDGLEATMHKESKLLSYLNTQPVENHAKLAEWAIQSVVEYVLKSKPIKKFDIVKSLIDYYETKNRLVYSIKELNYTKLYDKYKKLDVDTGSSWFNKSSKYATATLPICHCINPNIRVFQPSDMTWFEINTVGYGLAKQHPYGYYMYEERLPDKLSVVLKVKFETDAKAKGVNMLFLQKTELEKIAKSLKVDISKASFKPEIIDMIEAAAWKVQNKIYPKRVIYRLLDL